MPPYSGSPHPDEGGTEPKVLFVQLLRGEQISVVVLHGHPKNKNAVSAQRECLLEESLPSLSGDPWLRIGIIRISVWRRSPRRHPWPNIPPRVRIKTSGKRCRDCTR